MALDRWARSADSVVDHYVEAAGSLARIEPVDGVRSAIFSSCEEGAGVTTAVLDVARALNRLFRMRVLIVELNQARPLLGRLLELDPAVTLRQVQDDGLPAPEAIQRLEEGLAVLPASWSEGQPRAAPIPPATVSAIVDAARGRFDILLFDAPPVLRSGDCRSAARVVPRVVLVLRSARTRSQVIDRVVEELDRDDVQILGSIINARRDVIPSWLYRRIA